MERLAYWIKNVIKMNKRNCRCFCPICEYFEMCREDCSDVVERNTG